MRVRTLPSFQDAYLRVLESVQLLKDVHGAQIQTSEPTPTALLEAGDESKHLGEGRKLVSISHIVANLGAPGPQIKRGSEGDGVQDNTLRLDQKKTIQVKDYIRRVEPEASEATQSHDITMRVEEQRQNENDFLLDPSRINDDTKFKETASHTGNFRGQSLGINLRDECCKGVYLEAMIRKLKNPLFEDGSPKKDGNYFGNLLEENVVQDSYEVLRNRSDALKDAIAREHSENQRLKMENYNLQHKINNLLSTVQQRSSGSCDHCRSIYENNIITMNVPMAPNKIHTVGGVPMSVGQDEAVEFIKNRNSNAKRMVFGSERANKGTGRLFKTNIPMEQTSEDVLGLPIFVANKISMEGTFKRKRGPDVGEALEGDLKAVTGKTKRLSEVENELLETQGIFLQTKSQSFSRRVNNSGEQTGNLILKQSDRSQGNSEGEGPSVKGPEPSQDDVEPSHNQLEDFEELEDPGIEHAKKGESGVNISSEEIETATDCSSRRLRRGGFEAAEQRHSSKARAISSRKDLLSNGHERKQEGHIERSNVKEYKDFDCGVTNKRGADTYGILRVNQSGQIQVFCCCDVDGCSRDIPIAPGAFEKHGGRAASKKWRETIWIVLNNYRRPISQVKELDEYLHKPQRNYESTKKNCSDTQPF